MAFPPFPRRLAPVGRWMLARLRSRHLWLVVLGAGVSGLLVICAEATFRARLGTPESRVPTALYTRPSSWRPADRRSEPVLIGRVQSELAEYRIPVRLDDVPDHLIQAVLAVEDQRFHDHAGFDLRRIVGAAVANVKSGSIRQGGSTITQQLAKNLFLSSRRTPLRKLREAAFASALEGRYDKTTILEAYLNEIYLGQAGGDAIHGVGAAARYYFGKQVGRIDLAESALLAGMIRAPNRYAPVRRPEAARQRRDLVLGLMAAQGRVSERDANRARRNRVRSRPSSPPAVDAPWFRDFVVAALPGEGRRMGARGGAVYTTLDPGLQRAANRAVVEGLGRLRSPDVQAALVALDPRTGDVLAMVGGREYGASQFNRAASARRQPGSAFKPVVALAALGRTGRSDPMFTLASVVPDEPFRVNTPSGPWAPVNYDRAFRGPVTFREALEQSLNVPFARIGLDVGPERITASARALGITSSLNPVPSLALGSSEVTPLELTRAYGTLAAAGRRAELRAVMGVMEGGGELRATRSPRGTQAVDPAEAFLVTSALEGVVARGTGRGLGGVAGRGGLAGKSGTSNNWRDAWFVAYTPTLVVGVWVGYDDGRSLGLPGSRAALPIVGRFLRDALQGQRGEPFPVPDGVEMAWTGEPRFRGWVSLSCGGDREVFLKGTAPDNPCVRFRMPERSGRGFDGSVEELVELLEEYGGEFARRLLDRLNRQVRRGGRGMR